MVIIIIGIIFLNLIFFLLIGIGSVSMASVEGVAEPWLHTLIPYWIAVHIPYIFYLTIMIKDRQQEQKMTAIKHSISRTAWLAFPGGIALFMFFGSNIPWIAVVIPLIQIIIAISVYLRRINNSLLTPADKSLRGQ